LILRDSIVALLTLEENQLMRTIDNIHGLQRISNDAWLFRSRRKRLFKKRKEDCEATKILGEET